MVAEAGDAEPASFEAQQSPASVDHTTALLPAPIEPLRSTAALPTVTRPDDAFYVTQDRFAPRALAEADPVGEAPRASKEEDASAAMLLPRTFKK